MLKKYEEPDSGDKQRKYQKRAVEGFLRCQKTCHSNLKNEEANNDSIADDRPSLSGGTLTMIHGIEKLIFVDKAAHHKIDKAEKQDLP